MITFTSLSQSLPVDAEGHKSTEMKNINNIDISTIEGRLLMAAIAVITTESRKSETPDEVLRHCHRLQKEMFKDREKLAITP